MNEQVLCFKRNLLEQIGVFQGLNLDLDGPLSRILDSNNHVYLDRELAEKDRSYKQLIPYVIVRGGSEGNWVFRYRRGKKGQENRLHGLLSIGVGGHISKTDNESGEMGYRGAMLRELQEEIGVVPAREAAVAMLNDDSTEVGFVHFAIVHVVDVESMSKVLANTEEGLVEPMFINLDRESVCNRDYESWSWRCLEYIGTLFYSANRKFKQSKLS